MNQKTKGDVSTQFVAYSNEMNKAKLKEAFKNSESHIKVKESSQNLMAENAAAVKCKD